MRVIAGKYKRRALVTVPGVSVTRPTTDRIKESVFNILAPHLLESKVVDLFSGSGALGIEALSRGAEHCIFVENNRESIKCIRKNLENLKVPKEHYQIVECDVSLFLKQPGSYCGSSILGEVTLIFADPPYNSEWYNKALGEIEQARICSSSCLVLLEMQSDRFLDDLPDSLRTLWNVQDTRVYAKTRIQIWERMACTD